MKSLLIFLDPIALDSSVAKKLFSQHNGLCNIGFDNELVFPVIDKNKIEYLSFKNNDYEVLFSEHFKINNIISKYITIQRFDKKVINKINNKIINGIDYLYFRKSFIKHSHLRILRHNHLVKILEIPTYPYLKEFFLYLKKKSIFKRLILFFVFLIEFFFIRFYIKKFNQVVLISHFDKKELYGVKVKSILNGYSYKFDYQKNDHIKISDKMILGLSTSLRKKQGLSRLLKSISIHNKSNHKFKIFLKIATVDSIVETLSVIKSLNIEKYISFHKLNSLVSYQDFYHDVNIGVGTIPYINDENKDSINNFSPMKTKEYISVGIPFISSFREPLMPNNFYYLVSNDYIIDFEDIFDFYQNFDASILKKMRETIKTTYNWNNIMYDIIHTKENNGDNII